MFSSDDPIAERCGDIDALSEPTISLSIPAEESKKKGGDLNGKSPAREGFP